MAAHPGVAVGLDRLIADPQQRLRGRPFGLVTSKAARGACGTPGFMLLAARCGDQLKALFAPEHGLDGTVADGEPVESGHVRAGAVTGLPVYSLYGSDRRRPSPGMLDGLELLIVDLQDIGARYYTYISTMLECLHAAAEVGIPLLILDRPNPLGGDDVEGPGIAGDDFTFVSACDVPIRHGLTMGELCMLEAARRGLDHRQVEVLAMQGWDRGMQWQDTGLIWYPPSPAATSLNMVRLYPGTCLLEGTNVSEGRGTDAPFELIGAPWVDGDALALELERLRTGDWWPVATPARFVPQDGKHAGSVCGGVRLEAPGGGSPAVGPGGRTAPAPAPASSFGPVGFGVALLEVLRNTGGDSFAWRRAGGAEGQGNRFWVDVLAGGSCMRSALDEGVAWQEIAASWSGAVEAHRRTASGFRLYGGTGNTSRRLWPCGTRLESTTGPARAGALTVDGFELDLMPAGKLARYLVKAAGTAVASVEHALPTIARAIELAADRIAAGGRLIYAGAGTSGRLGLLDASECEPTFGVQPGQVIALIAGGPGAAARSREGAEDDEAAGVNDLNSIGCTADDVVVGIAASGSTPYTLAVLREARRLGALRIAVAGCIGSKLAAESDVAIEVESGQEPLRGSTRLLAGTAHKVVLNTLSTGVFSRLGLVYGDRMVGVQASNRKLWARAVGLVSELSGASPERAAVALEHARTIDSRLGVRLAILSLRLGCSTTEALGLLAASGESLRGALRAAGQE